jgi:hypothetical protein
VTSFCMRYIIYIGLLQKISIYCLDIISLTRCVASNSNFTRTRQLEPALRLLLAVHIVERFSLRVALAFLVPLTGLSLHRAPFSLGRPPRARSDARSTSPQQQPR